MKKEILEKLWQYEIKILDEIDRICQKHNITYFLMWGTLIGAVRHKGFIPWDDDIDLAMDIKNYKKFLKVAPKELGKEFFLQTSKSDKFHPTFFSKVRLNNTAFYSKDDSNRKKHHGIFVDLLPLYNYSNPPSFFQKVSRKIGDILAISISGKRENTNVGNRFIKKLPDALLCNLRDIFLNTKGKKYYSWGYFFEKSDFYPATKLEFCGKLYPVPKEYDKVLTTVYGDYMKLPPKEKQVAHNPGRISFDTSKQDEEII